MYSKREEYSFRKLQTAADELANVLSGAYGIRFFDRSYSGREEYASVSADITGDAIAWGQGYGPARAVEYTLPNFASDFGDCARLIEAHAAIRALLIAEEDSRYNEEQEARMRY